MTGKTHLAVGEAAALLLTRPTSPGALVLCLGTAAIGSVICDVDAVSSRSHKQMTALTSAVAVFIAAVSAIELHFGFGFINLLRQTNLARIFLGLILILLVCNYGMRQPHRSFMHSLPGWLILSALVWEIFPGLTGAFAIAMASHILLDLLNRKRVRLLYPLHWGLAFRLCPSDGHINDLICVGGTVAAGLGLVLSLWSIFV